MKTSITWFLLLLGTGRFSCTTQGIEPNEITLLVYTQARPSGSEITLFDANIITAVSPFDTSLNTIFYIHGYLDTVQNSWVTSVREALLSSANVNIIIVNWDSCAVNDNYLVSQGCVADVGQYIGQFVEDMTTANNYSKSRITLVGHSLGAHIAGYMGKNSSGIGVIVGLDPAGPLFPEASPSTRLTKNDALHVQVVHTEITFFGVNYALGVTDFWVNGGSFQTGCGLDDISCSHTSAVTYYAESVTYNNFYARKCDSYIHFQSGDCSKNDKSLMAGVVVNITASGFYYLQTNAQSPHGQGDVV